MIESKPVFADKWAWPDEIHHLTLYDANLEFKITKQCDTGHVIENSTV
ncbi:10234_t:CDS:2 [Acaulospora colombiana]|uniref:10234_t:CDS:1 n=1 Tax=Acaulospora colombiana TaxID=27376 RepID=A0ACA9KGQ6_9GLOM|nr:10234_t:CDS:2 [Acaulospora colombiana]